MIVPGTIRPRLSPRPLRAFGARLLLSALRNPDRCSNPCPVGSPRSGNRHGGGDGALGPAGQLAIAQAMRREAASCGSPAIGVPRSCRARLSTLRSAHARLAKFTVLIPLRNIGSLRFLNIGHAR